jgi:glucuronate isomerase
MSTLSPARSAAADRCFSPEPAQRSLARELFAGIKDLPIVGPHGHVDPRMLAEDRALPDPAQLFIVPDHYVFRMLYSQGVPMADLGVPSRDGSEVERDPRTVWQRFAEHFHLFRGTPTGLWLTLEFEQLFGIDEKLNADNAQRIYDAIQDKLQQPAYRPRALFEHFNIHILATTDAATDTLEHHRAMLDQGFDRVRPTFRPDAVLNLDAEGWRANVDRLAEVSGLEVSDYPGFLRALEQRRSFFKQLGAAATDHAALTADVAPLPEAEASALFERALAGTTRGDDAPRFTAHMLFEMARMSAEDGLVMQLHVGSLRNHNSRVFRRFGLDKGADMPLATEWTRALQPLMNAYGNDPRYRLVVYTLDESSYSRELAPMAGHYPALTLGAPWWFFDSVKGMERYLDAVMETAGAYNLAGFNDDTRAFASIPARHEVWRRVVSNWLAGQSVRGLMDEEDAHALARALAYEQVLRTYRLEATA